MVPQQSPSLSENGAYLDHLQMVQIFHWEHGDRPSTHREMRPSLNPDPVKSWDVTSLRIVTDVMGQPFPGETIMQPDRLFWRRA